MRNHAWADTFPTLTATEPTALLDALASFVPDASAEQHAAWRASVQVLQAQGTHVLRLHPPAERHAAVLEYELPREGGRRPDVVVLQNGTVVVLEFKSTGQPRRADVDQVAAYARDLRFYHSACHALEVVPVLVLTGTQARLQVDGVHVIGADRLGETLLHLGAQNDGRPTDLPAFLQGEYAPLPGLVQAARLLFDRQDLPFIRRAHSAGVPQTVEHVLGLARRAAERGERHLVLLTGVPGAGKTLVGLQVAHSAALDDVARGRKGAPATFLSGNGPLVQVLQHALKSTTFVQDMHRYIREYGLQHPSRVPPEHVVIFDEAQRAWDAAKIEDFYRTRLDATKIDLRRSEPQLLVEIAERVPGWSLVLGLVGSGQEIHVGEEAGLGQWADALAGRGWHVHGPPELAPLFAKLPFHAHAGLTLDTTLRAHAAADLHAWVEAVLAGDTLRARPLGVALRREGFPIYVTRDLDRARSYARDRFVGEPLRRYGQLASSRADRFLLKWGIDCGFQATKVLKIGPWFNDDPRKSKLSCCHLQTTATEFQAQGLELDLPIVCWGDDFRRQDGQWILRKLRPNPLVRDPFRLRANAYRVLLTRGREGLIVYVPPDPILDETAAFLVEAGAVEARAVATDPQALG